MLDNQPNSAKQRWCVPKTDSKILTFCDLLTRLSPWLLVFGFKTAYKKRRFLASWKWRTFRIVMLFQNLYGQGFLLEGCCIVEVGNQYVCGHLTVGGLSNQWLQQ